MTQTTSAAIARRDVPDSVRRDVLAAGECAYCGDRRAPLTVEHVRPLGRGGSNERSNLSASCVSCNSQKRAMLLHEWRAYRLHNGMPWPPIASHATEPCHYSDNCSNCDHIWAQLGVSEIPSFRTVPYEMLPTERGYRSAYRCPVGHAWTCFHATSRGYFSDCECGYCAAARGDNGDETYTRPEPYTETSRAYAMLLSAYEAFRARS